MAPNRLALCLVLLLAVTALPQLITAASPCCVNIVSKTPYEDCTCLEDDNTVIDQHVGKDEYAHYHWRLTDWSLINVPDSLRPSITFTVSPCIGNTHLFVRPIEPPFPTAETARWSSTHNYQPNGITSKLLYAEYLVSVLGVEASNFTIVAVLNDTSLAQPGNSGTVLAQAVQDDETILFEGDLMSMSLSFKTSQIGDAEYRIYGAKKSLGHVCGSDGNPAKCIVSSGCGLRDGAPEPMTAWLRYPANTEVSLVIGGLDQNQDYVFNVMLRQGNHTTAYVATEGTPTYDRVTQAQSDTTIIIVAIIGGIIFLILVALIVWAKVRLNRAYQRHQYIRYQQGRQQ